MGKIVTLWVAGEKNYEGEKFLRKISQEVSAPLSGSDAKDVQRLLRAFLGRDNAVGLAAPQIGISKRIIAFRNKGFDEDKLTPLKDSYELLINPRIISSNGETVPAMEGCLSCPEIQVEVMRHPKIKVHALNKFGKSITKQYENFVARIVQHEIDHLDGILIIDRGKNVLIPNRKQLLFAKLLS